MGRLSDSDVNRGAALDAALLYRSRSRVDVASAIGVSASSLSRWITGATGMTVEALGRLCDELDLPADYLVRPPATRAAAYLTLATWDESRQQREGR